MVMTIVESKVFMLPTNSGLQDLWVGCKCETWYLSENLHHCTFLAKTLFLFCTINHTVLQFHPGKIFAPALVPLMPTNIVSGGVPNVLDVGCCRAQCGDCVSAHVGEDIGDFTGFLLICLDRISHCLSWSHFSSSVLITFFVVILPSMKTFVYISHFIISLHTLFVHFPWHFLILKLFFVCKPNASIRKEYCEFDDSSQSRGSCKNLLQ